MVSDENADLKSGGRGFKSLSVHLVGDVSR